MFNEGEQMQGELRQDSKRRKKTGRNDLHSMACGMDTARIKAMLVERLLRVDVRPVRDVAADSELSRWFGVSVLSV